VSLSSKGDSNEICDFTEPATLFSGFPPFVTPGFVKARRLPSAGPHARNVLCLDFRRFKPTPISPAKLNKGTMRLFIQSLNLARIIGAESAHDEVYLILHFEYLFKKKKRERERERGRLTLIEHFNELFLDLICKTPSSNGSSLRISCAALLKYLLARD
jgi:hypothetical protein